MADSDLWREFADAFLKLAEDYCDIPAQCQHQVGSDAVGDWALCGEYVVNVRFDALARRAAVGLPDKRSVDLLVAWLEALREEKPDFELSDCFGTEQNRGTAYRIITINRVCQASANLCKRFESAALQVEFEESHQSDPQKLLEAPPARPSEETVAAQIRRLREECRLTVEELGELVNLEPRSVQRHEAGTAKPYPRYLSAYERVFSKLLNRRVVISKLS